MDEHGKTLQWILEWMWAPAYGALVSIGVYLFKSSSTLRLSLLEQRFDNFEKIISEYDSRRREDRQEITKQIDAQGERLQRHSDIIFAKLDAITDRLPPKQP